MTVRHIPCVRKYLLEPRIVVTVTTPDDTSRAPLDEAEMATWHAFIRAHSRVIRRLEAELEGEHGLSLPAYEVLSHLSTAPERRLRMTDLAKFAVLTPSGLTRLVDKLSRDGMVERQRCGADARVVYACLTSAGMARLERAYPTHLRGVREHFLDWLSQAQQHALSDSLSELVDNQRTDSCTEAAIAEIEAVENAGCDAAEAAQHSLARAEADLTA
jgi:DNA-binding MarR family transcriptional regulator